MRLRIVLMFLICGPLSAGCAVMKLPPPTLGFVPPPTLEQSQAEAGNTDAQFNLAWMYDNGQGVPQDYKQAVHWYRKAAEAGNTSAQFNLAWMYANGQGVPQDSQQAAHWYRKAAEAGHMSAQFNLASRHAKGQGVPLDYVRAHVWANLAASGGGKEEVEKRDAIAWFMTPHQIAEAQKLASEWKPVK